MVKYCLKCTDYISVRMKIHNFYTLWTKNNIKAAKCSDHQKYCSEFENSQNGRFGFDVFILKSENTVQCKNYKTKSKKHNLQVIQPNWTKKSISCEHTIVEHATGSTSSTIDILRGENRQCSRDLPRSSTICLPVSSTTTSRSMFRA